nr:Hok/Gef family protein [Escherichia coli]
MLIALIVICITVIVTALITKKDLCKGGIPRHL